jgi:hypothetical protein
MTTGLEEELAGAMRSRTAGLRPSEGLVARAAQQHRRRLRRRTGAAVGAAVAVAVVVAATLTAAPNALAPPPEQPEMWTVAAITERASAALADDDIEHSVWTATIDGNVMSQECWRDPVTADQHCRTLTPQPGARNTETWRQVAQEPAGTVTWLNTLVDHTNRTWTTREMRSPDGEPLTDLKDDPRSLFQRGIFALVGEDVIDGTHTFHLRRELAGATDDIWVEADTFRLVRTIYESDHRQQLDYNWMPRTPASLELLKPAVPSGYTRR